MAAMLHGQVSSRRNAIQVPSSVEVLAVSFGLLQTHWREYEAVLSAAELAKARRYRFDHHRIRYVAGRGFVRYCLAGIVDESAAALRLIDTDFGKPGWPSPHATGIELQFNISHSDTHLILAMAIGPSPIGIDIEPCQHNSDLQALARSQFSVIEQDAISRLSDDPARLTKAFFNIWTRKEAVIKALGNGLSMPLASFDTHADDHSEDALMASRWPELIKGDWRLLDLPIVEGHAGALCCDATTRTVRSHKVAAIETVNPEHRIDLVDSRHWTLNPDKLSAS